MLFCNNHILGHARTAFEDSGTANGGPGRLLVRAWMNCDQDVLA